MAIARMSFTDTSTEETVTMQFNPERVRYVSEATYAELAVLGLSHEPHQYSHTKNVPFDFSLRFDALITREWDAAKCSDTIRFLESLTYPRVGDRVGTIDPPTVVVYWPRLMAVRCKVHRVSPEITRMARNGYPTLWEVGITLKQVLEIGATSVSVRNEGIRRSR